MNNRTSNTLTLNLLLAVVWMFVQANFSLRGLLVGYVIGFGAIAFVQRLRGSHAYVLTTVFFVQLTVYFLADLVRSSVGLARDILRKVPDFAPALVRFEVADLSPIETALLANLISLTPGTLTVDAEEDGRALYVHSLYAHEPAAITQQIERLSRMIRRAGGRDLLLREGT